MLVIKRNNKYKKKYTKKVKKNAKIRKRTILILESWKKKLKYIFLLREKYLDLKQNKKKNRNVKDEKIKQYFIFLN